MKQFSRTEILLGEKSMEKLRSACVAIFGIGGVGGYVAESLVRSGIGNFVLIDNDEVSLTNLNRQIIATHSSLGMAKVECMKERMLDINPEVNVVCKKMFFLPENSDEIDFSKFDYVVDAIDTISAKIEIIMKCQKHGIPVISAMGAGNKLDPSRFKVADVYKTSVCPLARVMRNELKKRGVKKLKVVYSDESPQKIGIKDEQSGKMIPGSIAFSPASCGLVIASEVIKDLIIDICQ
ncbi:MAG: tRNA threonylcarbamoyladenosine dehydratase [Treponemataceae bacterium]|nr:tRNA threonylcarbamoyladenosine dehydratase [Spirochaetales bacterium]MDY6031350.1 tRNA threonylcarbamoyladenosine dehydratase [Treponemataceae bacterium]